MRLYVSAVLSVMVYGSEAWRLTTEVQRAINGANSKMVAAITGRPIREEAQKEGKTFDAVASIRATRLKWLGSILRMDAGRMVQKAVKQLYQCRQEGDLLMDAPASDNWEDLVAKAKANDGKDWRALVREIKDTIHIQTAKGKDNGKKRTQSSKTKKENGVGASVANARSSNEGEETAKRQRKEVGKDDEDTDKDDEETDEDDDWGIGKGKQVHRKKLRKPIYCRDGFAMSVQASREHFCSPRDDYGPYNGVEVGYPSEWEDLLLPFTDNNTDRTPVICGVTPTLYVNVPPSAIRAVIQKHGGMTADSGNLPPMVEVDEDGHLWAAAAEPPSTTSEEDDDEEALTSVVHMGAPPPSPPPMTPEMIAELRTTTQARRGAITPPQTLTLEAISPIEKTQVEDDEEE